MNPVKPWKIIVAFSLVFIAGITVGMVWAKYESQRAFLRSFDHDTWVAEAMERLDSEVALTPEQEPQIRSLVETGARQVRENIVRMATDSALLIDHLGDEIDQVLTPEQREAHGRMREEFRQRMREALGMRFDTQPAEPAEE